MNIAVIDADLIGRPRHRFPNLTCMKISGYHKFCKDNVIFKLNYNNLDLYDVVYICKVFTDTPCPDDVLKLHNVVYGGTGFFFDKAKCLPNYIEHHKPDYHLYDDYVQAELKKGHNMKAYTDYSIGFLTRGCFRQCSFCVNRNQTQVQVHSPLNEFIDESRPKICLLDDNFLGYSAHDKLLDELQSTSKPFVFKQGLDIRLLNYTDCCKLFSSKHDKDVYFAFDNIDDYNIIEKKLQLIRSVTSTTSIRFYILCGFDKYDTYDEYFWLVDISNIFKRIKLLARYNVKPYLMRYKKVYESSFAGLYTILANWINYPATYAKQNVLEFVEASKPKTSSYSRYLQEFTDRYILPDEFYWKFSEESKYPSTDLMNTQKR